LMQEIQKVGLLYNVLRRIVSLIDY
jgi:hypothetical protein